jgi:hypothetical protein
MGRLSVGGGRAIPGSDYSMLNALKHERPRPSGRYRTQP